MQRTTDLSLKRLLGEQPHSHEVVDFVDHTRVVTVDDFKQALAHEPLQARESPSSAHTACHTNVAPLAPKHPTQRTGSGNRSMNLQHHHAREQLGYYRTNITST